jgi:hypothetical protein
MDGRLAGDVVHPKPLSGGLAQPIGCHDEGFRSLAELAGGAFGRQGEHDRGAGDRPMAFILHANPRFASDALANEVYGAFTLDHHDIQLRRDRLHLLGRHFTGKGY